MTLKSPTNEALTWDACFVLFEEDDYACILVTTLCAYVAVSFGFKLVDDYSSK